MQRTRLVYKLKHQLEPPQTGRKPLADNYSIQDLFGVQNDLSDFAIQFKGGFLSGKLWDVDPTTGLVSRNEGANGIQIEALSGGNISISAGGILGLTSAKSGVLTDPDGPPLQIQSSGGDMAITAGTQNPAFGGSTITGGTLYIFAATSVQVQTNSEFDVDSQSYVSLTSETQTVELTSNKTGGVGSHGITFGTSNSDIKGTISTSGEILFDNQGANDAIFQVSGTGDVRLQNTSSSGFVRIGSGSPGSKHVLIQGVPIEPSGGSTGDVLQQQSDGSFTPSSLSYVSTSLASGHIFVGNVSGVAADTAMSGDATISNTGAVTLKSVGTPASYGAADHTLEITTDTQGRVSAVTSVSIAIAESQVTNLTTDLAAKAPLASPTFTGTVTLPSGTVTLAMMANETANTLLGNNTGSAAAPSALTASQVKTLLAITESDVGSLTSDLALKAPLASPALTGTPTAPTATLGTNTTQIATTAFVIANASSGLPTLADDKIWIGVSGTATATALSGDVTMTNAGVVTIKSSVALAGNPTTTTQSPSDNSTKIATTAYADAAGAAAQPTGTIIMSASRKAPAGFILSQGNVSRTQYAALFAVLVDTATVTTPIASPGVVNDTAHGFLAGDPVSFSGGTLPTGITTNTTYYVVNQTATVTTPVASPGVVNDTAHGFVGGEIVTFDVAPGSLLPTGLAAGNNYYVLASGLTTNTYSVSLTPGGTAVNFTGTNTGSHTRTGIPANTYQIAATAGGSAVNFTGTSSGTQTRTSAPFGIGDGVNTFGLPSMEGNEPMGTSPTMYLGQTMGSLSTAVTHTLAAPAHTHTLPTLTVDAHVHNVNTNSMGANVGIGVSVSGFYQDILASAAQYTAQYKGAVTQSADTHASYYTKLTGTTDYANTNTITGSGGTTSGASDTALTGSINNITGPVDPMINVRMYIKT
jgi:hypothetical protein